MPPALSPADRTVLLAGTGVLVLLVIVGLLLAPPASREAPTSYSASSVGFKAAFLLVKELGYDADRWERAPAELTDPRLTTIILAEPAMVDDADREALLRFVDAGGRVVVTGQVGAALVGLVARPNLTGTEWQQATAVSVSPVTRAAPAITLAPATVLESAAAGARIYAIGDDPVVTHTRRQSGDIFWWASPTPLSNAGITAPGNLPFVLAVLGPPGGRRILFDEYFHGYRATLAQSLMLTPVKWMLVQLGIIALVVVATYARRSGPILPGVRETRLSPLEFVQTMSQLYRRAHAGAIPVGVAYAHFRSALRFRFGIPLSADPATAAAAAARVRPVDEAALAETLRACDAIAHAPQVKDRDALSLVQALHDRSLELGLTTPVKETR